MLESQPREPTGKAFLKEMGRIGQLTQLWAGRSAGCHALVVDCSDHILILEADSSDSNI